MAVIEYSAELQEAAATVVPEGCEVSPAAQELAAIALNDIDQRYGETSENPQAHHNAEHSLDVIRRGIRLTNILYPYINEHHQTDIYDLVTLAGAAHDYEQGQGYGRNEWESADYAVGLTKSSNYTKFQEPAFIYRLRQGISATEVELNVRGRIDQPNLRRGATDPLKFIMAFSDINAIAMEGTEQMIKDATNLCFERNKAPSVDEYKEFLAKQPDFLRSRLNDVRIKTDIARYFPDTEEEVFGKLWDNFHENIVAANDFACRLTGVPGLNQILRRIIKANPLNAGRLAVEKFGDLIP